MPGRGRLTSRVSLIHIAATARPVAAVVACDMKPVYCLRVLLAKPTSRYGSDIVAPFAPAVLTHRGGIVFMWVYGVEKKILPLSLLSK